MTHNGGRKQQHQRRFGGISTMTKGDAVMLPTRRIREDRSWPGCDIRVIHLLVMVRAYESTASAFRPGAVLLTRPLTPQIFSFRPLPIFCRNAATPQRHCHAGHRCCAVADVAAISGGWTKVQFGCPGAAQPGNPASPSEFHRSPPAGPRARFSGDPITAPMARPKRGQSMARSMALTSG